MVRPIPKPAPPKVSSADRLKRLVASAEERGPVLSREEEFIAEGGDPEVLFLWGDPDELARLGIEYDDDEFKRRRRTMAQVHALATRFPKVPEIVFPEDEAERARVACGAAGFDVETKLVQPGRNTPTLVLTGYQAADGRQAVVTGDPDDPTVHARAFLAFTEAIVREHMASASTAALAVAGGAVPRIGGLLVNHNIAFDFAAIAESAHQADVALGLVHSPDSWFDAVMTRIFEMLDLRIVEDTWMRERLIDLAEGTLGKDFSSLTASGNPRRKEYKLASLAANYLGVALDKHSWRYGYHRFHNKRKEEIPAGALDYVTDDVEGALQVRTQQQERAENNGLAKQSRIPNVPEQTAASFALQLVSSWGMRTSLEKVQALDSDLDHWQRKLEYVLKSSGLVRKDGSRDMKRLHGLVAQYYKDENLDVPLTKSGKNVSTKGSVLEDIALLRLRKGTVLEGSSSDDVREDGTIDETKLFEEPLYAYSQYTSIQKLQTTYLPVLYAGSGRPINTRFETILETGRISSFQPNLNNLPRGGIKTLLLRLQSRVRECFVPRPGFVFCSVDYSAIELCTLAQVCIWFFGMSKLGEAINAGKDPHLLMAAEQLLHISYEEALKRKKEQHVKDMRQLAKPINFGLPGGLGAKSFCDFAKQSYNVYVSEDEARELKLKWLAQWPEMTPYFNMINSMMRGGFDDNGQPIGDIEQFVSGRIRGRTKYCAACNTFFQGLAADGAKSALYALQKESYLQRGRLYGSRVVAFLYDEFFMEHPEETAAERAWIQRDIAVGEMQGVVTDVRITAEPALCRYWLKAAEPTYDKTGRLIPFTPEPLKLKAA